MRKEILRLLEKGKELHEQLNFSCDETLASPIIEDGNDIVEVRLPVKVNSILVILNAQVKSKKYPPINNLQQAIEVFKNTEVQHDIDKAIANKELVGLSDCQDCFITIHEILDAGKREMQSLVEQLNQHATQCRAMQPQYH
ncbi:MAG: hypothetical protein ACM3O8_09405 [Methylococcaceae bacterium]|nr:hypothetical protein [Prolixibacteraceae bacterium]